MKEFFISQYMDMAIYSLSISFIILGISLSGFLGKRLQTTALTILSTKYLGTKVFLISSLFVLITSFIPLSILKNFLIFCVELDKNGTYVAEFKDVTVNIFDAKEVIAKIGGITAFTTGVKAMSKWVNKTPMPIFYKAFFSTTAGVGLLATYKVSDQYLDTLTSKRIISSKLEVIESGSEAEAEAFNSRVHDYLATSPLEAGNSTSALVSNNNVPVDNAYILSKLFGMLDYTFVLSVVINILLITLFAFTTFKLISDYNWDLNWIRKFSFLGIGDILHSLLTKVLIAWRTTNVIWIYLNIVFLLFFSGVVTFSLFHLMTELPLYINKG